VKCVLVVLACAVGAFAAPAAATPARPLSDADIAQIRAFMSDPPFNEGTWGILATDLETGRELFSTGADKLFHTASTTKNFTTAAGLDGLGAGHRFRTPLLRRRSDLILRASGDLTMGGRALPNGDVAYTGFDHMDANEVPGAATLTPQDPLAGLDALARKARRSGIRSVRDVVIDDRLWKEKKVGAEVVSPIIVNDNAIDITMRPTRPGQRVRARTRPATAAYDIDVRVRTVAAGGTTNVVVGEAKGRKVRVTGTLAADTRKPFVQIFRVPDPAYFARTLLIEALERAGVRVEARTLGPNRVRSLPSRRAVARLPRVARLVSPRLGQFVKLIQKVSHNLGANTVPFWLGVDAGNPTFAEGMRRIRAYARQAGVRRGQAHLVDGQGGPDNQITPNAMVTLLRYIQTRPYQRVFLRALPVKGIDGIPPEGSELDPATGHVFAKNGLTGALNAQGQIEVQAMALAGYAIAGDRRLAFNVVANHIPIYGPDGKYSEDPDALAAAFTRFENHEGITSLLYTSQIGD
jgi:D-alanyl-D-alanine carboxypeptidase/D-alanyl-D-alanine-endopeptidase (penicillin-binding protein 4)